MERAGAALWYDRSTQSVRNSAAHDLQEFFSAVQKGRIQCLAAYRTLTGRLAAAEHGDPYVPPTTTCDAELALAEVYVSEVFDDPLRQVTRPALELARTAKQEQQNELCRAVVGEIRRTYFEAVFGVSDAAAAAARQRMAAVGVDFEPTPRSIGLASRFPCRLETAAAARWWDTPGNSGVTRTSADRKALADLFREAQQGAIRCLSAYQRVTQRLGTAERRDAYLPATAPCESELAIAEVYVSEVFDDPLRQVTRPALEIARSAQRERQTELCRVAVGEVRRAYFEAIFGVSDAAGTASRQRLAAVGIDFDPTPLRIRLASRFPCSLETAVAAGWSDHPGLSGVTRTRADREALADLFREAQQTAIRCLSAYRRVTQRLGAAEQRSAYEPSTAACESELAIAEVYVADVFDAPLRQQTIPTLEAARAAQRQGGTDDCRRKAGEIRRAYFEAIYGSH
jgi:hypothetical protein